jgi:hypothetical protein
MNLRQVLLATSLIAISVPLLAQTTAPAPELEWVDAKKLTVEGLGFKDVKSPYDRLPARAEGVVPAPVWNLSRNSAGALVRFTAATTEIRARWTLTNEGLADSNITAIASSGLDLYARTDTGKWRWLGFGAPKFPDSTAVLISGIPATERELRTASLSEKFRTRRENSSRLIWPASPLLQLEPQKICRQTSASPSPMLRERRPIRFRASLGF